MSNRNLRWGLLSTAQINRALIKPLRASDRNQLVAGSQLVQWNVLMAATFLAALPTLLSTFS